MESATKWCPGDSFDVGILRGTPGTIRSLMRMQNGRHFPLPRSCSLTLCHSTSRSRCGGSPVWVLVDVYFSIPLLQCHISTYPYLHYFLPLTLVNSNNTPFTAAQPITLLSPAPPPPSSLSGSLSLPLSPFIKPNLFVMSSLGKLCPICCHSLNEFICLCIGHGSISPSPLPRPSFLSYPPSLLLVFPWGLYIYQEPLQAPIVPLSKLTDRCPAAECGREPRESGGGRQLVFA